MQNGMSVLSECESTTLTAELLELAGTSWSREYCYSRFLNQYILHTCLLHLGSTGHRRDRHSSCCWTETQSRASQSQSPALYDLIIVSRNGQLQLNGCCMSVECMCVGLHDLYAMCCAQHHQNICWPCLEMVT